MLNKKLIKDKKLSILAKHTQLHPQLLFKNKVPSDSSYKQVFQILQILHFALEDHRPWSIIQYCACYMLKSGSVNGPARLKKKNAVARGRPMGQVGCTSRCTPMHTFEVLSCSNWPLTCSITYMQNCYNIFNGRAQFLYRYNTWHSDVFRLLLYCRCFSQI